MQENIPHKYYQLIQAVPILKLLLSALRPQDPQRSFQLFLKQEIPAGQLINSYNEKPKKFCVLVKGSVLVLKYRAVKIRSNYFNQQKYQFLKENTDLRVVNILGPGDYFGYLGEQIAKMNYSILSQSKCTLLSMDVEQFRANLSKIILQDFRKKVNFLRNAISNQLSLNQLGKRYFQFISKKLNKGSILFQQDQKLDRIFILLKGELAYCHIRTSKLYYFVQKLIKLVEPGKMIYLEKSPCSCIAQSQCQLVQIPIFIFTEICQNNHINHRLLLNKDFIPTVAETFKTLLAKPASQELENDLSEDQYILQQRKKYYIRKQILHEPSFTINIEACPSNDVRQPLTLIRQFVKPKFLSQTISPRKTAEKQGVSLLNIFKKLSQRNSRFVLKRGPGLKSESHIQSSKHNLFRFKRKRTMKK